MRAALKKQFLAGLADLSAWEGWRSHEAMRHFLTCAFSAIKKTTVLGPEADACEQLYMDQVARCRKADKTMSVTAQLLGVAIQALGDELADFIGPVFMETSASEHMGQFFTPHDVCYAMAECTLQDAPALLQAQSHITIDEPACGAGAMILACCQHLWRQGVNYQERCGFRLTDLDHEAYMAAYIQCSLAGIPALVVHGNTLTLEVRDQAVTPMMLLRPWLGRESQGIERREKAGPAELAIPTFKESDGQLGIDWEAV